MTEIPSNVAITTDVAQTLGVYLQSLDFSSVGVVMDENTVRDCYPLVKEVLPTHCIVEIPAGEDHKKLETCSHIWEFMTQNQLDRGSLIINLGGGVISDMGGFCAATFKRGVPFINLPTTLLAQVDASIGGKLGIDFQGFKNHIGIFKNPEKVIISTEFLKTLPDNELHSGFAEVLKHALIADSAYWQEINDHSWNEQPWGAHILHSVTTKNQVVTEDPQESGLRKTLNYGHTIGHAIERYYLTQAQPLLHGEAIAIGMICEAFLSHRKVELPLEELEEITTKIMQWFGKVLIKETSLEGIAENALQDKKNINGHIRCTLLQQIGEATYDVDITTSEITEALRYYIRQSTV